VTAAGELKLLDKTVEVKLRRNIDRVVLKISGVEFEPVLLLSRCSYAK